MLKFEYHKKTVTKTVGLQNLERVAGWCEAMAELSNDLSLLSRRTERRELSRLLPYCCVKAKGLIESGK